MDSPEINYNKFFGFSELPFQAELDQKFLFLTSQQEALLADLVDFVSTRQGVALLEGDSGVGKTVLAHALLQRIPQNFHPLIISRPAAAPMGLMVSIGQALAIDIREGNLVHLNRLEDAVQAAARQGQFYLVLLDGAHELTDQHLEEVWVLSQMELNGQHLLPFLLVARPALSQRLGSLANQRLARLPEKKFNLTGLTPEETLLYIDHRLHQVGSSFTACFAEDCPGQLFILTGGNPRRINTVCHQLLERCWQDNLPLVTLEMLGGEGQTDLPKEQVPPAKISFRKLIGAVIGAALVGSLAAYVISTGLPGEMSFRSNETPGTSTRALPSPPPEQALSPAVSPTSPTPQKPVDLKALRRPAPPQPEPLASQKQQASNKPSDAGASPPPPPDIRSEEAGWTTSVSYQVTARDHSLSKIVAAHYPDNEKFGFVAVILANPQITEENLIYPRQILVLPKINKTNNIIKLDDNRYYVLYNRYNSVLQLNKTVSMLKSLHIRFVIRQTEQGSVGEVYRVYLGGYEREDNLKEALAVIEKG